MLRNRSVLRPVSARPPGQPRPEHASHLPPWWPLTGLALSQVGAGLPPACYAHYRDQLALSDAQVTSLFAFLIAGVMAVLWLCRSGFVGVRRGPTLAAALVVGAAADLLFLRAGNYFGLALASSLLGCVVGAMCALVPGVLTSLVSDGDRASSWVTVANAVGLAAGPVLAGAANQLLPLPYQLVYAVHGVLCLTVAAPLRYAPAGVAGPAHRAGAHHPRPGYRATLAQGYLAFAVGGLVTSLAAVLAADEFGVTSSAASGALITLFFTANAGGGGVVLARLPGRARRTGTVLLAGGLVVAGLALTGDSLPALAAAVVLAGAGQGALIGAGIAAASRLDGATGGNTAVAVFFLWCYAGAVTAAITVGWFSGAAGPGRAFLTELALLVAGLAAANLSQAGRSGDDG